MEKQCPPLGTGSVDVSALHQSARKNADMQKALAEATTRVTAKLIDEPEPSETEGTGSTEGTAEPEEAPRKSAFGK